MSKVQRIILMAMVFALALSFSSTAMPVWGKEKTEAEKKKEIQQVRDDIRKMAKETLARLYKLQPGAKKSISKSAGYGVFSNFGMKIFVAGSGKGKGIVFDNKSKKQTFMKMIELQAGLGLGVKKFRLVWVFENHKDVNEFINSGWELGAQTSAAAKMGDQGGGFAGAMSVSPGIWVYQLTDDGLALELTGKGTKYYKDDDLN
jgi:lipid-binding SYLF domain-containing protein